MSLLVAAVAATVMAATAVDAGFHVERVDLSAYPDVSVVVSAPLDEDRAVPVFRVVGDDGDDVRVQAAPVPPRVQEVVVIAGTPEGADATVPQVRSAVMDLMLHLPPDAQVTLLAAADPPEVVTEPGATLQARMVAASALAPGAGAALPETLDVALRQFSGAEGTVRSVVVVGAGGDEAIADDERAERFADAQVAVHAVEPADARAAARLAARLSRLYRLSFRVRPATEEVEVQVESGEASAVATVALPSPPASEDERPAIATVEDFEGGSAGATPWPALALAAAAAAAALLLSASILVPRGVLARRGSPPGVGSWDEAGQQVADETGADEAVFEAAEDVDAERDQAAWEMRSAGLEARLAAAVLAAIPLAAAAVVLLAGGGRYEELVAGVWRPAALLVALLLTVAGAVWLRRVTSAPFSAAPSRWREYDHAAAERRGYAHTLDVARLYAAGGLGLDEALARAGAGDPEHPARRLLAGQDPAGSPAELLASAADRVRSEQVSEVRQQAAGVMGAVALPFAACTLPATVLVAAVAWASMRAV